MRLDKFLSNFADVSRSEAKLLLKKSRVTVNGVAVRSAQHDLVPEKDCIVVDGRAVRYSRDVCLVLNKPAGYVCSTDERDGIPVGTLLPDYPTVFPAGRLDKETEGMLVMTDNGELVHRLITPSKHVTKYYIAQLEREYEAYYAERFAGGIILGGEQCMPAAICPLKTGYHALIELREGKYHQVRRMLDSVGNKVVYLRRIQIGLMAMPRDLPLGGHLEIMHNDIDKLLKADSFDSVALRVRAEFSSL